MGNVALVAVEMIEAEENLEVRRHARLTKQQLRDVSDPFHISEELFRKHYRMVQWVALDLIERLIPFLPYHPKGVPPHLQVLAVLRFLAEGGYQKGISQDYNHPMSQSSISKYLHAVIPAIQNLSADFIKFPTTEEEREVVSNLFQERLRFPGVLGLIDCTLIGIHRPTDHEEAFLDHHQNHSLNVQVISDINYNIMSVRVCNGSTHDAFVWRYSEARAELITLRRNVQNLEGRHYYFIDSGYTQSPYLMTPVNEAAEGSPAYLYSQTIRRTRCRVEQLFGIWKEVLRCLNGDRILHYGPNFAAQIIRAAAIIYNFLRHHGMPMPIPPQNNEQGNGRLNPVFLDDNYNEGLMERQAIIDTFLIKFVTIVKNCMPSLQFE